jgi:hypothetical protein
MDINLRPSILVDLKYPLTLCICLGSEREMSLTYPEGDRVPQTGELNLPINLPTYLSPPGSILISNKSAKDAVCTCICDDRCRLFFSMEPSSSVPTAIVEAPSIHLRFGAMLNGFTVSLM